MAKGGDKKGGEKKSAVKKGAYYQEKDGKLERTRRLCPKCGEAVFMAEHKDRTSCGKCGYTEFKKK